MPLKSLENKSDEQLMKLYQNGDESAFQVLYHRHSAKIYGFLSKRLGNKEKVAEVYQEVFIKIHKSKSLYKEDLPLLPWIFTITKTVMLDDLRKDKKIQTVELEDLPAPASENDSGPDVLKHLNKLPEVQKQALEMRYVSDSTFEQIAETLNLKPTNVRQVISRGLKKLRELVKEGEDS